MQQNHTKYQTDWNWESKEQLRQTVPQNQTNYKEL